MSPEDSKAQADEPQFRVVVNHEEQYSIWPLHKENPAGWNDAGKSGTKEDCLAYISEVWTDMRPLSLRRQMEKQAAESDAALASDAGDEQETEPERMRRP